MEKKEGEMEEERKPLLKSHSGKLTYHPPHHVLQLLVHGKVNILVHHCYHFNIITIIDRYISDKTDNYKNKYYDLKRNKLDCQTPYLVWSGLLAGLFEKKQNC